MIKLQLLITCAVAMSISALGHSQTTDVSIDNIHYTLSGTTATVWSGRDATGDVTIPSTISHEGKDYTVTEIGNNAFNLGGAPSDVTSVTLPNTITTIGEKAFYNLNIESFTIPESVKYIKSSAFENCRRLKSIVIPGNV